MRILLRFGYIGDLITAIESSKSLGLPLYYAPDYLSFLCPWWRREHYRAALQNASLLSQKLGHPVHQVNLGTLRRLNLTTNSYEVLLLAQTPTRWSALLVIAIRILLGIRASVLYDGAQWFYSALSRNNMKVRKHFAELPITSQLNVCINWDAKEEVKNLSAKTISTVVSIIRSRFSCATITIIGKEHCNVELEGVSNVSGQVALRKALELVDSADLLVTCDTGPLHYAAARGIWTVAFVAARYPLAIWYPFSEYVAVVSDLLVDCRQLKCAQCSFVKNVCVNGNEPLVYFAALFQTTNTQTLTHPES